MVRRPSRLVRNPARGALNATAALASAAFLVFLDGALRQGSLDPGTRWCIATYAVCQLAMFAVSGTYHMAPVGPRWFRRLKRADHSMIFLKIASGMSPILWLGLEAPWRVFAIGGVWAVAGVGILTKLWVRRIDPQRSIPYQVALLLFVLPALVPFAERFPGTPSWLIGASLVSQSIGLAAFVTKRPRVWPGVFSFHEVFHVFVILGSLCYSAALLVCLARL